MQTEGKIDGGRSRLAASLGRPSIFSEVRGGQRPKFFARRIEAFGQDRLSGLDLREPGPAMPDASQRDKFDNAFSTKLEKRPILSA